MWRRLAAAAGISLIVGGFLWLTVPERREAFATVRISAIQLGVLPDPIYDPVEFATFKQTQSQLVKSGMVIRSALRNPSIAKMNTVRAHEDPVDWLTGKLTVDFPEDGEIMRIGLRGEKPEAHHFQSTERQYQILRDEYHKALAAFALQQKTKGVAGTPHALAKKEVAKRNLDDAMSYRNQVRKKVRDLVLQIELETAKTQREVKTADDQQTESPGLWEMAKERELQEAELTAAEESVEQSVRALSNLDVYAADLDQMQGELQLRREILDELAAKMQRRRVEQFAPQRITVIDPATVDTPASAMIYLGPAILTVCGLALVTFGAWPNLLRHKATPVVHQA
jgi:hypothetical protein